MREEFVAIEGALGTLRGILHSPVGPDSGWSVVFVQGYFSSTHVGPARLYVQLARRLAQQGIECLRIDPYGVGDSDGDFSETSYESELADYRTALDWVERRQAPRKLALLGHCLGAGLSIRLAAADPRIERALLISPAFGSLTHFDRLFNDAHKAELANAGQTVRKATFISGAFLETLQSADLFAVAHDVSAEVVVFYGSADQYFDRTGTERIVSLVPHARAVDIQGGDHNVVAPGARDALTAAFVNEIHRLWPTQ